MAPRRQILACLALLAGGALLLGCGSEGEKPSISEEDAAALESRLDAIREDADQKDCTGSSTVFTRLDATRDQIDASEGINEQGKSDLNELLGELEGQIQEECDAAAEASTSTTSSDEHTAPTEEDTTTTHDPVTDETTTSTKEETTTEESTTTVPDEPTEPTEPTEPPSGGPPITPPGQSGGGNPSGGVGPGFGSGRKVPG